MEFTENDIDLIEKCLNYYLLSKKRLVSYDEYMESKTKIQKLLDKIHQLDKEDEVKTVDNEPIVRCKDCKNCEYVHNAVTGEIIDSIFFCKIIGYSGNFDFFCSDGKRKD